MPTATFEGHVIIAYRFQFCHLTRVYDFERVLLWKYLYLFVFFAAWLMGSGKKSKRRSSYSSPRKS